MLQPLIWAGPGRRYPWALLGLEAVGVWFWAVMAAAFLILGPALARRLDARHADDGSSPADRLAGTLVLLSLPFAAVYDVLTARHFVRFGYGSPIPLVAIAAAGTVALVMWIRAGRPLRWGAAIAVTVAVAHRLASIAVFPADERRSDMLFIIARALDAWSAGGSAYAPVSAAIYPEGARMPYLPGTWLAHVPAHALGLDLRLGGAIVILALGAAVVVLLRSRRAELLAVLVLVNPYHLHRHELYFDHFLALTLALFAWAACPGARGWPWIAALVGVAVATRQWAWIYGPFVLLAAVAGGLASAGRERAGVRPILARLTLSGAILAVAALVVCVPGILPDPARFQTVLYLLDAAHGELCLGFASAAIAAGLVPLLRPVQIIVCIGTFAHAFGSAVRGACPASILATGWFCLVAVIAFSSFQENYFWLTPGFAALGLALGDDRAASVPGDRHEPAGAS